MTRVKARRRRPTRNEQAKATRRRIIEAALAAFVADGYSATTVEAIAHGAGVAVQTVYFIFGTKGGLLQAVYAHVVLGPDGLPPHLAPWWRQMEEDPDLWSAVHTLIDGTVEVLQRSAPLVWAVLGDPTAREGYEYNEGLRRAGNEELVRILSAKHSLRPGLSPTRAADILLVLTGPQLYSQLTHDLGWTAEEVATWVTTAVLRELFGVET